MERTPVNSSSIASVGYDPDARKLHVEFANSGKIYEFDCEPQDHLSLMGAESIGAHFNKHVRPLGGRLLK